MSTYDETVEMLRDNGYNPSKGADRWGVETWARKGCPSVRVSGECGATAAEKLRVQVEQDVEASANVRKPKSFRKRATAARKNESIEKRRADIEARIAERNRELGGAQKYLTIAEGRLIRQKIEADERELREIKKLMSSIPGPRADAGSPRAKHRS